MDTRALAMGLAFATIWSSAFTTARIIVADAPPLAALSVRFLISGAIALVIAWLARESLVLTRAQWRATIVFGICQNALYLGLNWVAMQTLEASVAAIIASTMPLLVAAAGWAFAGERIGPMGAGGLVLGFTGVALIMSTRISGGADPVATRRVAKVVDTGEAYLKSMASVIARLGDRQLDDRVEEFQVTAREMFRTVERDPRDLTAARKYMGVYLMGARDAADRFATVYERSRSPRDRADFIALLDDMQARFEARTETLLADNRADMEIEIEVLRERLIREGVRPEPAKES